jgi:hypothetical protein
MYANINNPANFQLQDFAQFGFRVITTDFIPVSGEQYRTLYVLQDAVVTATTQKGDDITSKAILAGTLLHGLFNSVSITSGRVLAYAAGRVTADEIIAIYEAYVSALGGTLENTQCAIDTLNDTGVDLFADASLVMIPDGYGTGVVYGQRPLTSDSQLTFTRASTATRVGPSGAIAVVGSNVPRIDYTGGGCGKLLLEPQRTNFILYSEQFNNAAWTSATFTVTANSAISPDGTQNADTLPFIASESSNIYTFPTTATTGVHTFSIYVKVASGTKTFRLRIDTGSGPAVSSDFTATTTWQRFEFSATTTSVNLVAYVFNGSDGVAGDLLVYGAALEQGAYATSYIPTTAAAVTRLADACSKTGISSLIGQTEGTLFVEFTPTSDLNTDVIQLLATAANDNVVSISCGGGFIYGVVYTNPNYRFQPAIAQTIPNNTFKVAICYKTNDFTFFINGVKVASGANSYSPSAPLTRINFNEAFLFGNQVIDYKSVLVFPVKLSDADAIALTA